MRVLLLNQTFYPDVAATAQHAHDLARHLVDHGHEVVVIASRSSYGERGASLPRHEWVDGVELHRVGASLFGKSTVALRAVDFALFYAQAALRAFTIERADVVVTLTTPPFIALVGKMLKRFRGSGYIYWVMDLYPDIPVAVGMLSGVGLPARLFEAVNRICLRDADATVVLGRCMRDRVLAKGVSPENIQHIGVWSDSQEVVPGNRMDNSFRSEWGLGEHLTIMYAGNFGIGHDVQTMCEAARELQSRPELRFVFVGGGRRKPHVDAWIAEHGMQNALSKGYQPRSRLSDLLTLGDIHLVSLREELTGMIVPSKLFGILAAARPTIFIGHPDSEIARIIAETNCGLLVRSGDVAGLQAAIEQLADRPVQRKTMGSNARIALATHFDRERACNSWQQLLETHARPRGRL